MKGVEMMIANLLGLKPEDMRSQVEQAIKFMETGAKAMASMQSDITKIKNHLGIDTEGDLANGGTIPTRNSADRNHIQL